MHTNLFIECVKIYIYITHAYTYVLVVSGCKCLEAWFWGPMT